MQLNEPEKYNYESLRSKVSQVQGYLYTDPDCKEIDRLLLDIWNGLFALENLTNGDLDGRVAPKSIINSARGILEGVKCD